MGNLNSNTNDFAKKVWNYLDKDKSGVITLDQILHFQKLPEVENWATSHSPLLLYRVNNF